MGRFYQDWDRELMDYRMFELRGQWFRGPRPDRSNFIACLGAAQTFGRFCAEPYPVLLARSLGMQALNLGSGGKSPEFYLRNPQLIEAANEATLVVLQVMSARGLDTSRFRSAIGGDTGTRLPDGEPIKALELMKQVFAEEGADALQNLIAEHRRNYVNAMSELMRRLRPPTVLFWFSERAPEDFPERPVAFQDYTGAFPQLVNREVVDQLIPQADCFFEFVSSVGLPQPLIDRNGQPAGENLYYPSPEMHQGAAAALLAGCRALTQ